MRVQKLTSFTNSSFGMALNLNSTEKETQMYPMATKHANKKNKWRHFIKLIDKHGPTIIFGVIIILVITHLKILK